MSFQYVFLLLNKLYVIYSFLELPEQRTKFLFKNLFIYKKEVYHNTLHLNYIIYILIL